MLCKIRKKKESDGDKNLPLASPDNRKYIKDSDSHCHPLSRTAFPAASMAGVSRWTLLGVFHPGPRLRTPHSGPHDRSELGLGHLGHGSHPLSHSSQEQLNGEAQGISPSWEASVKRCQMSDCRRQKQHAPIPRAEAQEGVCAVSGRTPGCSEGA